MIETMAELVNFVYDLNVNWGEVLELAVIRKNIPFETLLDSHHNIVLCTDTVLHLDSEDDLFLVWNSKLSWSRVTEPDSSLVIEDGRAFTKAIYAERTGDYFYVVGDLEPPVSVLSKEVPPL